MTLMVTTNYFHSKLSPSVVWMRDISGHGNLFRFSATYNYTEKWQFTLGALIFNGAYTGVSMDAFDKKDYMYFKIGYKWS